MSTYEATHPTLPPTIGEDSPRARRTDPISSHEAADATAGIVAESQRAVARLFRNAIHPMTALEVEERAAAWHLPYSPSRIRSALPELAEKGVLERAGFVRREGDKRKRQLWKLVTA